jgi:hypothetical protein
VLQLPIEAGTFTGRKLRSIRYNLSPAGVFSHSELPPPPIQHPTMVVTNGFRVILALLILLNAVLSANGALHKQIVSESESSHYEHIANDRSQTAQRQTTAWDEETLKSSVDFIIDKQLNKGIYRINKRIRIRNNSEEDVTYKITPKFRTKDTTKEAVTVSTLFPGKVKIGAGLERNVSVVMTIRGEIMTNDLDSESVSQGDTGLSNHMTTRNDYAGYLEIDDGIEPIYLPWHVIFQKNNADDLRLGGLDVKQE